MHDMKGHDMKVHETCSMKTSGPRCTQVTCDHAQGAEGRRQDSVIRSKVCSCRGRTVRGGHAENCGAKPGVFEVVVSLDLRVWLGQNEQRAASAWLLSRQGKPVRSGAARVYACTCCS